MAWTAEDTIESYSVGTLNAGAGGTGWSGDWGAVGSFNPSQFSVVTTTAYEGTKAVIADGGTGPAIGRALSTSISASAVLYIAMRRTTTGGVNEGQFTLRNTSDQQRVGVFFNISGRIILGSGGGAVDVAPYSINTWYVIRLTFNPATNAATMAYSTNSYGSAGTFSAESSSYTMGNTGDVAWLVLNGGDDDTMMFDYISGTSPFVAGKLPAPILTRQAVKRAASY
jgi:hypothetical protein